MLLRRFSFLSVSLPSEKSLLDSLCLLHHDATLSAAAAAATVCCRHNDHQNKSVLAVRVFAPDCFVHLSKNTI